MLSTLDLLQSLLRLPSVTPKDAGCQKFIAQHLEKMGFVVTHLPFGEVENLWARLGTGGPLFVFAGHTDVVPPGILQDWTSAPFEPTIRGDFIYGRGAADMKASLAAMIVACANFLQKTPKFTGSIAFLLTSDEEGPAINGTQKVIKYLQAKGEKLTWCVVGEPSSQLEVGDVIKIGRRGSLSGKLVIHGKQGHIAYPHLADNPIHRCMAALLTLCQHVWDKGDKNFPPTSFQISNIHAGVGVGNVIPAQIELQFNFRYSPMTPAAQLQEKLLSILDAELLRYDIEWQHTGLPFLTEKGQLLQATAQAVQEVMGFMPKFSTDGGTSDGRFIAPTGCEVIELGPCNATIHQVDECVRIADLDRLSLIYQQILTQLFQG